LHLAAKYSTSQTILYLLIWNIHYRSKVCVSTFFWFF